jgi:hypothetical protein
MFAIGEKKTKVSMARISMPVEYKLKRRKIYGCWAGENVLYISDEIPPLKAKKGGEIFEPFIDINNNIHVPASFENRSVMIRGCISTIEIAFE